MTGQLAANVAKTTNPTAKPYGMGLCLSGGGYRAMLFHAGALARLNEAGLLQKLEVVSSVSGGSITAGVLASAWRDLDFVNGVAPNFKECVLDRILTFSEVFVDAPSLVKGLLNPWSSAAHEVSLAYRGHLFGERTLSQLTAVPWFIFCASNLSTGSLFRMSNRYLADYRIGLTWLKRPDLPDAGDMLLADAVACSSAFPPFLSPFRFDVSRYKWEKEKLDEEVGAPVQPGRAVLTDGGVYDNHGIEPALKRCRLLFVSDGGAPWRQSTSGFWNWFSQLKRVLDTADNQVRALRRSELIETFKAAQIALDSDPSGATAVGLTRGCYWSIAPSSKVLASSPELSEFLGACSAKPMDIPTVLHFLGGTETAAIVNWGYLITDQALRAHHDPQLPPPQGLPVKSVVPSVSPLRSRQFMKWFGF